MASAQHADHEMPKAPDAGTVPPVDHEAMGHDVPAPVATEDHAAMGHGVMRGALGGYPMTREASGTAWQPDASEHAGYMSQSGEWSLMAHGNLDLIADTQGSRRGDDKIFV